MAFEIKNTNLSEDNLAKFYNMARVVRAYRIPLRQLAKMVQMPPSDVYRFFHFPDNEQVANLEKEVLKYIQKQNSITGAFLENAMNTKPTETR